MKNRLAPALFFCLLSPAFGGVYDLHGLHPRDASDSAPDALLDQVRPDLRQRLEQLPPETAASILTFYQDASADSRQRNAALQRALEVEETMLQLVRLQEQNASGGISPKEYQRRREEAFRRLDGAMINHMSRTVHRAFMADMREPLKALGYDLAARHAKHWQEKDPGAEAYAYGASSALGKGDRAGALQDAQTALKIDPNNISAYGVVADASYQSGRYEDALLAARRVQEIEPGNPQAVAMEKLVGSRTGPASLAASGPGDEETPRLGRGGSEPGSRPEPPDAQAAADESRRLYDAAVQHMDKKEYLAAFQTANAALRLDPKNWGAMYVRARVQVQNENWGEALRDTERALQNLPPGSEQWSESILVLQAVALNHMGDYAQALAVAQRAIGGKLYNSGAYMAKAWALAGLGRRKEALEALRMAANSNGKLSALYLTAQKLPEDGDLLALFQGGKESSSNLAPAPAGKDRTLRTIFIVLTTLIGGLLIALGLLHVAARDPVGGVLRWFGRSTRPGLARRTTDLHEGPSADGRPGFAASGLIAGMYQVLRQLGVGGMGVVYEAVDRTLERKVAIKKMREEIRADPRERERFLHEARTVAALHHPNIVEIYSIVEDGADVYLVFEHVDGRTVHELIQSTEGALPFDQALAVMRGACAALDYAHKRNVIHRDLKPSNIMIDKEGLVKVMDFGVARQAKDSLSRLSMTNTVVGTPPYMAPEQEQGVVRRESDLYALAVCLYEMVTGQLPFNGVGAGMLIAKLNKTYLPPSRMRSGLPSGFDEALARALDPDPEKRWKTAADFISGLEALATPR